MKNVNEFLIENNFCIMDNICIFCSLTMDGWDSICRNCNEYKGVMNIAEAVKHYGTEIVGY